MTGPAGTPPVAAIERRIARILSIGTGFAVGLLAIGVGLLLLAGRSPTDPSWPALDPGRLPADLLALRPEGFLWLGLVATLATPLLRVAASVLGFRANGELRMAALGVAVLLVIALAVATARLTGS